MSIAIAYETHHKAVFPSRTPRRYLPVMLNTRFNQSLSP